MKKTNLEFLSCFNELEDPRIDRKKLHSLSDILLILFCEAICGAESWRDFVRFAAAN
ncbi:MAG: transposase family protein [Cellvibrionaceae bacterium]|nr:transposase family protein [Cellvibrionaceae bacterium]